MDFSQYAATKYNTTSDDYWGEHCFPSSLFDDYAGYLYHEHGRTDFASYWGYMDQFKEGYDMGFKDYYDQWQENTVPEPYRSQFSECSDMYDYISGYMWSSPWHDETVVIGYVDAYIGELYSQYELTLQPSPTPEPAPGQTVKPTDVPDITGSTAVTSGSVVLAQPDISFPQLTGVLVFCMAIIAGILVGRAIFERF